MFQLVWSLAHRLSRVLHCDKTGWAFENTRKMLLPSEVEEGVVGRSVVLQCSKHSFC